MTVYQISGLGADIEVFSAIKLNYKTVFIPWIQPQENESMESYAHRMSKEINTTEPFALMGVSFGGIMIQEIAKFMKAEKLFVISSVITRSETPLLMRLTSKLGLSKRIPKFGINKAKRVTNYLFGATKQKDKDFLSRIMDDIDLGYLRWSLSQIGNWKGNSELENVIRFHGEQDLLFPSKNLKNVNHWLDGGHLVSITQGKKISNLVNEYLKQIKSNS